jgi:translation elongation factor EF-4
LSYFEVSAKENIGIEDLFRQVAKVLPSTSTDKKKATVSLEK